MAIAEALKVNAVVTTLALGNNNIGNDGAKAIAEALKVNVVLTKLVLWEERKCILGDAGKQAFQDAVKGRSGFFDLSCICKLCENCGNLRTMGRFPKMPPVPRHRAFRKVEASCSSSCRVATSFQ
jgi:hypothetical protein